jgi:uncharacterized protein
MIRTQGLLRAHWIGTELSALIQEADLASCSKYMQHGDTSCLLHCVAVAFYSASILDLLHLRYDRKALIRGALLHDFFLYDWHTHKRKPFERMHAFSHPHAALQNARERVALSPKEENIILRHMFPVTPVPPNSKEGLVVCLADKCCAFYEGVRRNTYPKLRRVFQRML